MAGLSKSLISAGLIPICTGFPIVLAKGYFTRPARASNKMAILQAPSPNVIPVTLVTTGNLYTVLSFLISSCIRERRKEGHGGVWTGGKGRMNTTFWTWLTVAAVAGGVLLLLLGMPTDEGTIPLVLEDVVVESAEAVEAQYWEPVTASTTAVQYVGTRCQTVAPCGVCGQAHAPAVPVCMQQAAYQLCGACGATQSTPTASVCAQQSSPQLCGACGARPIAPVAPVYVQRPAAASCSQRVPSPCAAAPCYGMPTYCGTSCGNTCPLDKPGINRNMEQCVDECTFVQLHSTIPYPICADVRFEWSTSKGSFLDPTAPDPVFYVPTTHFPDGEDVWVVVTITDGSGAQYTDQLKLHVVNLR